MTAAVLRQTPLPDPFRAGIAGGWKVIDASALTADLALESDVAIVGTGAGGATAAEILSAAGLSVVMIEEGPLATSSDFHMLEREAYPQLYQESAARKTRDKAINILQGRCVGGGTTVNWTSSFRTPPTTLTHWSRSFGITGFTEADLAPWFERVERRLNITPWEVAPNENNDVLRRGAEALGIPAATIRRNVKGCWNIGYCGVGCPTNAKQSMLVTAIPAALSNGATLLTRTRAWTFDHSGGNVTALNCVGLDARSPGSASPHCRARQDLHRCRRRDRHAGAAAAKPRAGPGGHRRQAHVSAPDRRLRRADAASSRRLRRRTADRLLGPFPRFAAGRRPDRLQARSSAAAPGAGRHHAVRRRPAHAALDRELPRMQVLIALMRDGFHAQNEGGTVSLQDDGTPSLDYPLNDYFWDGARRALATMAEIQFAAGATTVMPVHVTGASYANWSQARPGIAALPLKPLAATVVSAHVMGGCPLGPDSSRAVADPDGRHHHLGNLYVFDGSLFPTSVGANPQLSIYGIVAKLASALAQRLAPTRTALHD
jgi:hypothetical protein